MAKNVDEIIEEIRKLPEVESRYFRDEVLSTASVQYAEA